MANTLPFPPQALPRGADRTRARSTVLFLLAVTALGCAFRLAYLSRPALWGDDALTFSRICGTYDQMLEVLREDGFGPLHYEVDWLLAQRFHMSPVMMRIWPAITGTLMVPAIYMLGFEMLGRQVARLACVLAACSGFLLAYSRDAKMYMPLWFAITVNIACMLWWMRTGGWTAWLGTVAAGCMAVGLHFTGFAVIGLDLLIGLTGPNLSWKRGLFLALAILLIVSGPLCYTAKFNRMSQKVDQQGWEATNISWVVGRTEGHDGAALAADSATSFLFAFSWLDQTNARVNVPKPIMGAATALLAMLVVSLVAGTIAWRPRAPNETAGAPELANWRAALWLSIWILVPVYGFYRATVPIASTWQDWGQALWQTISHNHLYVWMLLGLALAATAAGFRQTRWLVALVAALLLAWSVAVPVANSVLSDSFSTVAAPDWLRMGPMAPLISAVLLLPIAWTGYRRSLRRRIRVAIGIVLIAIVIAGICQVIDSVLAGMELHPVWMPRYLGFVCPAVIIAVAALLQRLPFAAIRWSILGVLLLVNIAQAAAHVFVSNEPPLDKVAADVIAAMDPKGTVLAFTPDVVQGSGPNATGSIMDSCGEYYLFVLSNKPVTPQEFRRSSSREFFPIREQTDPLSVTAAVSNQPQARRVIIWDRLEVGQSPGEEDVLPQLPKQWRQELVQLYPVRSFWDWGQLYSYRRRAYVR